MVYTKNVNVVAKAPGLKPKQRLRHLLGDGQQKSYNCTSCTYLLKLEPYWALFEFRLFYGVFLPINRMLAFWLASSFLPQKADSLFTLFSLTCHVDLLSLKFLKEEKVI